LAAASVSYGPDENIRKRCLTRCGLLEMNLAPGTNVGLQVLKGLNRCIHRTKQAFRNSWRAECSGGARRA
jgi:hypothetical protein